MSVRLFHYTSDHSTECYRNWWPDAEMLALMNRSIDLMEALAEESGNIFHMIRRGYLYVTADETKIEDLKSAALRTSNLGAGPIRVHSSASSGYLPAPPEGFREAPEDADLLIGNELIRRYFPYLTDCLDALHSDFESGGCAFDPRRGRLLRYAIQRRH